MIMQVAVEGFDRNFSYFVVSGREAFVVDPSDVPKLVEVMEENDLVLKGILVTHGHFDHVAGVEELVAKFGVPVYSRANLGDGEELVLGDVRIKVIYTPGHCDDAVCFLVDGKALLTGDTLFVEHIGRADFENSSIEDFWQSLARLMALDDKVVVYPGHDYGSRPSSTIGYEKAHNKYLLCADFEEFRELRTNGRGR